MIIDTSAIVAIALDEADAPALEAAIANDAVRLISTATLLEATIVLETRLGEAAGTELDWWFARAGVDIVAVDEAQAEFARRGWRQFGKGRHPAGLNYGDCFSYALAKVTGEPLLFKGNDFSQTDITPAMQV